MNSDEPEARGAGCRITRDGRRGTVKTAAPAESTSPVNEVVTWHLHGPVLAFAATAAAGSQGSDRDNTAPVPRQLRVAFDGVRRDIVPGRKQEDLLPENHLLVFSPLG